MKNNSEKPNTATCDNNVLENRFSHTLENCLFAKQELMNKGFKENYFYLADEDYLEIGYLVGEPMIKTDDDFCKSAHELWKESQWSEEDDNNMLDYYIENGLL
ncbi:hypothetical protein [Flavobacterium sp. J27]|uniref:hypothetical protein n=1 Tax=Flavobacterium sp. J27 TaxID=2060419 RepID=UPI0010318AEA|nr:hypothetical protein [Flavobacterium sp. J27]